MVKLAAIGFSNREGKKLLFNIPEEMKISFNYIFGTVEEEVSCAVGMIIAAPREDMRAFLTLESETNEKLTLEVLYFETEKGNKLREFKIPQKWAISFQKMGSDQQAADFAGTVFIKIISQELPFLK